MTSSDSGQSGESVTFLGDFSKKLATNTFFNVLGRFWSFFVTLLLTPYIFRHLGLRDYGIWASFSVFIGTANLLDLGLGSSFIKFVSAYYTDGNYKKINTAIFSGFVFYGLFGVAMIGVGLAIERPVLGFFGIAESYQAYRFALIACAVQGIGAMILSVFRGLQRMDKANTIEMWMLAVTGVGTVISIETGHGLTGLTLNALICSGVTLFVAWAAVRRAAPQISLGFHFDGQLLREMFGYGAKIQVSQFGALIGFSSPRFIILKCLGPGAVSFYELSSRLASYMRAIPMMMISALIPATSELGVRNDRARILKTYLLASKYVALVTISLVAVTVLEAGSLMKLWLGLPYVQEGQAVILQILAIGFGVNILGGVASQTGAGIGRPEFDMRGCVLLAILSPTLALVLVFSFGVPGVAAGTSLALIGAALYLLSTFHRNYVGTSMWSMLQEIHLRPIIAGILANLAVIGFHRAFPTVSQLEQARFLIPIKIFLDMAIFSPVYVVLLVALRQLTAMDWKNLLGLMAFGSEFLRHPLRERVKIYR